MRILVVEDDNLLNKGLKMALEREGYAVDGFLDGVSAEKHVLMNHSNYDLIILDYMLEGRNGLEICQALRTSTISIPVMMLTGVSDTVTKVRALDAGADDYVTKPFSVDELIARVRALLRRPRSATAISSISQHGPLVFNFTNKEVLFNDTPIKLTLKEYGILEYLIRNPNQVISRDQILDHVWDLEANAFSNIVDVHVTNLRKKLQKASVPDFIETARGIGFKAKL